MYTYWSPRHAAYVSFPIFLSRLITTICRYPPRIVATAYGQHSLEEGRPEAVGATSPTCGALPEARRVSEARAHHRLEAPVACARRKKISRLPERGREMLPDISEALLGARYGSRELFVPCWTWLLSRANRSPRHGTP